MPTLNHKQASPRRLVWMIAIILVVAALSTNTLAIPTSNHPSPRQNAPSAAPTELQLGQPIERELAGAAVHIASLNELLS